MNPTRDSLVVVCATVVYPQPAAQLRRRTRRGQRLKTLGIVIGIIVGIASAIVAWLTYLRSTPTLATTSTQTEPATPPAHVRKHSRHPHHGERAPKPPE